MKELSLNILDVAKNSVKAGAKCIQINIIERPKQDLLSIEIVDDGCGMSPEFLAKVTDPFTTTRTTRKVGLGLPFFKLAAESTGGSFNISSELDKGTKVIATFGYSHIDRMPMGDLVSTITLLIQGDPEINFCYTHEYEGSTFEFSCNQIKNELGEDIKLNEPEIIEWISEYLSDQTKILYGGNDI